MQDYARVIRCKAPRAADRTLEGSQAPECVCRGIGVEDLADVGSVALGLTLPDLLRMYGRGEAHQQRDNRDSTSSCDLV